MHFEHADDEQCRCVRSLSLTSQEQFQRCDALVNLVRMLR